MGAKWQLDDVYIRSYSRGAASIGPVRCGFASETGGDCLLTAPRLPVSGDQSQPADKTQGTTDLAAKR